MLKSEQQNLIDSQKKLINKLLKEKKDLSDKLIKANSLILELQDKCKYINKYIGKWIRFKYRYTRNKELVEVSFGDWFLITDRNIDNVLNGIQNGREYEIN